MRKFLFLLMIMVCSYSSVFACSRVQIPLDGLHRMYCSSQVETGSDTFSLQMLEPVAIDAVWIVLEGWTSLGFYSCCGLQLPHDSFYTIGLTAVIPDTTTGGRWRAYIGENMRTPIKFLPENGATFDFLISNIGEVIITVCGDPVCPEGSELVIHYPPCANIENAYLEVEGCFAVDAETVSWGSLKSNFR